MQLRDIRIVPNRGHGSGDAQWRGNKFIWVCREKLSVNLEKDDSFTVDLATPPIEYWTKALERVDKRMRTRQSDRTVEEEFYRTRILSIAESFARACLLLEQPSLEMEELERDGLEIEREPGDEE